jgi:hypothetical protein
MSMMINDHLFEKNISDVSFIKSFSDILKFAQTEQFHLILRKKGFQSAFLKNRITFSAVVFQNSIIIENSSCFAALFFFLVLFFLYITFFRVFVFSLLFFQTHCENV